MLPFHASIPCKIHPSERRWCVFLPMPAKCNAASRDAYTPDPSICDAASRPPMLTVHKPTRNNVRCSRIAVANMSRRLALGLREGAVNTRLALGGDLEIAESRLGQPSACLEALENPVPPLVHGIFRTPYNTYVPSCKSHRLCGASATLRNLPLNANILDTTTTNPPNLLLELSPGQPASSAASRARRLTEDDVRDLSPSEMDRHSRAILGEDVFKLVVGDERVRAPVHVDDEPVEDAAAFCLGRRPVLVL